MTRGFCCSNLCFDVFFCRQFGGKRTEAVIAFKNIRDLKSLISKCRNCRRRVKTLKCNSFTSTFFLQPPL